MIAEIDVWRAAGLMIKRYGDAAEFQACLRADKHGAKRDRDGQRAWWAILKAIDRLQNVQPGETKQ